MHSLKLTVRTWQEAGPQKGNSSSNHPFSGANCCSCQGENLYESMNPSAKVLNPWALNSMNQPINLFYFAHDAKPKRTHTPQADALEVNTINTHLLASLATKLYILDWFLKKHTCNPTCKIATSVFVIGCVFSGGFFVISGQITIVP